MVTNIVAVVLTLGVRPAAFVTLLGGVLLAISPWLLGYATDNAAWLERAHHRTHAGRALRECCRPSRLAPRSGKAH